MSPMPRKAPLVALLAAVTAVGPFSLQALSPALPAIATDFVVPAAVAQLMLSLSLVAMAATTLVWGPVSDRLGRRPVMVAGMLLAGAGSALSAVAPELWLAALGRLMQAGGAVAGRVLARAVAYWLLHRLRGAAPKRSRWRTVTFETLRAAFLKIAVRVEHLKTRIRLSLPSACPHAPMIAFMLRRIHAQGP